MIPKIIHYCWFGGQKPKKILWCMESWKRCLPDYEFREWNEQNYDIGALRYTRDAAKSRQFAFVSDVARVKALYEYGGIYLDTDVVVYQSFDPFLKHRCVFGFEEEQYIATSFMAAEPHHPFLKEFLSVYKKRLFYDEKGKQIPGTNVGILTKMLRDFGLEQNDQYQELKEGIVVYPMQYFSPYDYENCIHQNTEYTVCEHLFYVSWMPWITRAKKGIKKVIGPVLGKEKMNMMRKIICR